MNNLEAYEHQRPALAVAGAAIQAELEEGLFDGGHKDASIVGSIMDVEEMRSALTLPWNSTSSEVDDQICFAVTARNVPIDQIIETITRSFRVIETTQRPTTSSGERRTHLTCLIPIHLLPDGWADAIGRPISFAVDVRAAA